MSIITRTFRSNIKHKDQITIYFLFLKMLKRFFGVAFWKEKNKFDLSTTPISIKLPLQLTSFLTFEEFPNNPPRTFPGVSLEMDFRLLALSLNSFRTSLGFKLSYPVPPNDNLPTTLPPVPPNDNLPPFLDGVGGPGRLYDVVPPTFFL